MSIIEQRNVQRVARLRGLFEREHGYSSSPLSNAEVLAIYENNIDYGCAFELMIEEMAMALATEVPA